MDDNPNSVSLTDDDDLNTTAPNASTDAWKMPEPVFRKTGGKLPQGFEKTYEPDLAASAEPAAVNDTPVVDLEAGNIPASIAEPKPANAKLKLLLVFLGLAAMIAFIVVFLTVLYFFFWRS